MVRKNKKGNQRSYPKGTRTFYRRQEPSFNALLTNQMGTGTSKINQGLIPRGKKGASVIIGYILLITFGLVMSGIAYNYLKTYVPSEIVNCPSDSSLFIKEITCSGNILNITLRNSGKFSLDGFIIHSASNVTDEIATDNLLENFVNDSENVALASEIDTKYVKFHLANENGFKPNDVSSFWFDLTNPSVDPKLIEITPTIIKNENTKPDLALCSDAKISQEVFCS